MEFVMRNAARLGVFVAVGMAIAGCESITVTSNTLLRGTARLADATTNAAAGTSNATSDTAQDIDARNYQARLDFVGSQMAMLRREAARGQGDNLEALAYLMRIDDVSAFEARVQANYQALFVGDPSAAEFLARLSDTVGQPANMQVAAIR